MAALFCRLLFQFLFWGFSAPVVDDGRDYHRLAVNLVETGSFFGKTGITARRPPLYPFFIASLYAIGGCNPNIVRLVQIMLSSLLVVFIYLFCTQLYGHVAGFLAALFSVFYPVFIFLPSRLLTENVFVFLVFCSVWYLISHARKSLLHYSIGGALLGLAILTRPALLLSPPFLAIWIILHTDGYWKSILRFVTLCIGMTVAIAPWSLRNYLVFNQFVPVTTNAGLTLMHDNNFHLQKMGWAGPQNRIFKPEEIIPGFTSKSTQWISLNEAEQDKIFFNYAIQWMKQNPFAFASLLPRKLISYLNFRQSSNTQELKGVLMDLANFFSYGLLLPFMMIGLCWTARFESSDQRLLHLIIAAFLCGVFLYAGSVRLRLPIEPFLLSFAAFALSNILQHLHPELWRKVKHKLEA